MPDSLKVGEMRHFLVALAGTEVKGDRGQKSITWTPAFAFYAAKSSTEVNEQFSSPLTTATETVTFSTWNRKDITRSLRISDGTDIWNILTISHDLTSMQLKCRRIEND